MNLQTYYKRKRRNVALRKLAGVFLMLFFAIAIMLGLGFVFGTSTFRHILQTYGPASLEVEPKQPKAAPWLIFCSDTCFYVDGKGILSESAPRFSENPLPEIVIDGVSNIKLGARIMEEAAVKFISVFFSNIKSADAEPARIEATGNGAKIILKEGWHVLVYFDTSPEEIADNLKLLLDQKIKEKRRELEYIDMRFPNKAFYKFR